MAMEIKQHLRQDLRLSQELVMTPQLQQAIKLLQLSTLELADHVQDEMEQNPLLDEANVEENSTAESAEKNEKVEEAREERPSEPDKPEIDWEQYISYYDLGGASDLPAGSADDKPSFENFVSQDVTLQDHLSWQLRMEYLTPEDQQIGFLIIGNVDEDGYLRASVEELASLAEADVDNVEHVLEIIQEFDPLGVASRDLRESLLKQAKEKNLGEIVERVISEGLPLLENKGYQKLAKMLNISFDQVVDAAKCIASLEPRPGRNFSVSNTNYIAPDVYVVKQGDEYVVRLDEDGIPKLRISPYYLSLLEGKDELGKEAKGYINERMQAALWLIKSIQQRQRTLYKAAVSIVKFQKDFFDKGVNHLRPLILKDVAEDIEMHESTISRVTTNKYMHTPQGIFELKYFFSSAIQRNDGGEDLASRSVKARMKEVLAKENPEKPLSDQSIADILSEEFNLSIARRTVTKYREKMGVLPSSKRRKYF